ncbi:hypothetical protein L916_02830, partial [Phytophthora nicotianae]
LSKSLIAHALPSVLPTLLVSVVASVSSSFSAPAVSLGTHMPHLFSALVVGLATSELRSVLKPAVSVTTHLPPLAAAASGVCGRVCVQLILSARFVAYLPSLHLGPILTLYLVELTLLKIFVSRITLVLHMSQRTRWP